MLQVIIPIHDICLGFICYQFSYLSLNKDKVPNRHRDTFYSMKMPHFAILISVGMSLQVCWVNGHDVGPHI